MSKKNFKSLHETLSLNEQRLVILAYRDYKVVVQGVPELFFGSDFEHILDEAVSEVDRNGISILREGLREVFHLVISAQKHKDANPSILNAFFKQNLPLSVFEELYGEAGIEI